MINRLTGADENEEEPKADPPPKEVDGVAARDPGQGLHDARRTLADAESRQACAVRKVKRHQRGVATAVVTVLFGAAMMLASSFITDVLPIFPSLSGTMFGLGLPTLILGFVCGLLWFVFGLEEGYLDERNNAETAVGKAKVQYETVAAIYEERHQNDDQDFGLHARQLGR